MPQVHGAGFLQLGPDGVVRSFGWSDSGELTVVDYRQLDPGQIRTWINTITAGRHEVAGEEPDLSWDDEFESVDGRDVIDDDQLLHPDQVSLRAHRQVRG